MTGVPLLRKTAAFKATYPNAILAAELAWGAALNTDLVDGDWTDITTDILFSGPISISPMGRSDNTSKTQPAACSFLVGANNSAINYVKGPQSPNYPNVHQNVPLRVWVSLTGNPADKDILFQGEAWSFKPSWNLRGNVSTVAIRAAGKMRQLTQGAAPLRSPLTRSILNTAAPVLRQYWPCEDLTNSTQAASAVGGPPLTVTGTVRFAAMDYLTQTDFTVLPGTTFGTLPQPQLKEGGSLKATFSGGSASAWTMQTTIFCNPVSDNTSVTLFSWTDSTGRVWSVTSDGITTDSVSLLVNGSVIASEPHIMINEDVRIDAAQSGGNINWSFKPMLSHTAITGSFAGTLGAVTSFTANPNATTTTGSLSVGQVRVWDGNTAPNFKTSTQSVSAWNGYPGELATDRLTRLCAEQGVIIDVTGTSVTTMGPQGVDTFVNLLRECEAADLGVLGDGMGPGLYYITRSTRYNLGATLILNATTGTDLAAAPSPEDDDQFLRNKYVVSRKNGSTAIQEATTGPLGTTTVGIYDTSLTVNLASDTRLHGIAAWLVHLGTVEGYRYPTLQLDLGIAPGVASGWVVMKPGNRVTVNNVSTVSPEHPPGVVDVLAEGWSQQISPVSWTATLNCSPAAPWDVAVVAVSPNPVDSYRVGSALSTVSGTVSAGGTSMTVVGRAWTTSGPFPFDVKVAGWKVTVTNISGTTFTISPAPGVLPSGSSVTMWRPATVALA